MMKLIDVLLAANIEWPKDSVCVTQDGDAKAYASYSLKVWFDVDGDSWGVKGFDGFRKLPALGELADDYTTAIITREQYLQAAEARRGAVDAGPVSADAAPIPYPSLSLYGDRREVLIEALDQMTNWDSHAMKAEAMLGNDCSRYQQRITTAQDMLRELGVRHADPL